MIESDANDRSADRSRKRHTRYELHKLCMKTNQECQKDQNLKLKHDLVRVLNLKQNPPDSGVLSQESCVLDQLRNQFSFEFIRFEYF